MRKTLTLMCAAVTILMAAGPVAALEISVSGDGAAVVHESRAFDVAAGRTEVAWSGLSNGLAVSSLVLDAGKDTVVLSQSFESHLADPAALLQQAIGRPASVLTADITAQGTLLRVADGRISMMRADDELWIFNGDLVNVIQWDDRLKLEPTLTWLVETKAAGRRDFDLTYATDGLSWSAAYAMHLDRTAATADISGWIELKNRTAADFTEAAWHILDEDPDDDGNGTIEYDIPALRTPQSLKRGERRQFAYVQALNVPVTMRPIFDSSSAEGGVEAVDIPLFVRVINRDRGAAGLGMTLPAGDFVVYQARDSGAIRISGPQGMPQLPVGYSVDLAAPGPSGVTAERTQSVFRHKPQARAQEQDITVVLENSLDEDIEVDVIERPWGEWDILEPTHPFEPYRKTAIVFTVEVPAKGAAELAYTMKIAY
ncbi:MAG: hypothetical protein QF541_10875 [Lentisphaeria bacterium]|nr:hypothetical protein [Lentisphaeria bacterium]